MLFLLVPCSHRGSQFSETSHQISRRTGKSLQHLFLKSLFVFLDKSVLRNVINSQNFIIIFFEWAKIIQKQSFAGVLKNFTKFTGKRLCGGLCFNKVTGSRVISVLGVFPVNTFIEHLRWLNLDSIEYVPEALTFIPCGFNLHLRENC